MSFMKNIFSNFHAFLIFLMMSFMLIFVLRSICALKLIVKILKMLMQSIVAKKLKANDAITIVDDL